MADTTTPTTAKTVPIIARITDSVILLSTTAAAPGIRKKKKRRKLKKDW